MAQDKGLQKIGARMQINNTSGKYFSISIVPNGSDTEMKTFGKLKFDVCSLQAILYRILKQVYCLMLVL